MLKLDDSFCILPLLSWANMAGKCSQRKIWPWSTFGAQRVHWNGHLRQIKINLSSFPSLFAPITIVYPQLFNNQYLSIHPPHTCVKHSQGLRQLILMSSISQKWRRQRLLIPILLWRYLRMYVHLVVSGTFSSASRVGLLVFLAKIKCRVKVGKSKFPFWLWEKGSAEICGVICQWGIISFRR